MTAITENDLQQNWQQEIERCIENHEILQIVREQKEDVVILSLQDWRAIAETLYLNQNPALVKSIHQAAQEPLEQGVLLKDL
jgi:antitoxin YefM